MKNYQDLLEYLKQLPKQGEKPDPGAEAFKKFAKSADDELGKFKTATENTADLTDAAKSMANAMKALQAKIPAVGKVVTEFSNVIKASTATTFDYNVGLDKVLGYQKAFQSTIAKSVKSFTTLEVLNRSVAKSFNLSVGPAGKLAHRIRGIGQDFQKLSMEFGDETLFALASSLEGVAGGALSTSKAFDNKLTKSMMQGQGYMQQFLGVSEAAAQGIELFSTQFGKAAGGSLKSVEMFSLAAKEMADASGGYLDKERLKTEILEDIGNLSADVQLQYGRYPKSLAQATVKMRLLGMEMGKLQTAADAMLNIESSIGDELEYQLLSGRRLTTESGKSLTNEYRMASLKGDANKQAQLMTRFLETQGDVLENNLLARKKAASLMGVDEADIAKSLQKMKLIKNLGMERLLSLNNGDIAKSVKQMQEAGQMVDQKKINELMKLSDKRTTEDIANEHLEAIRSNTAFNVGDKIAKESGGISGNLEENRKNALNYVESAKPLMTMLSNTDFIKGVGAMGKVVTGLDGIVEPLGSLTKGIPLLDTAVKKVTETFNEISKTSIFDKTIHDGTSSAPLLEESSKKATGGPVKANKPYLVGEIGPELFVPQNSGRIVPNHQMAKTEPTTSNTSNNTINYAAMANAIATALANAKITAVATVKYDDLYKNRNFNA